MHVLEEHGSPLKDPELFAQAYINDKKNIGVFIDHTAVVQKCSSCSGINTFGDLLTCMGFRLSIEGSFVALISDRYDSKLSMEAGETAWMFVKLSRGQRKFQRSSLTGNIS